ncbi:MAG: hypothetical protein ACXADH_11950, partial [Candidatus Kariarchaeaceae archaeon]
VDHKEEVRKGNVEPVEETPKHEVDDYTDFPDNEDVPKELLGRYQKVGNCKCCQATVYVEEYNASKVVRPRLIYTCEDWCMAGFDARDVKWSPNLFGVPDISKLTSKIDGSPKEDCDAEKDANAIDNSDAISFLDCIV